MDYSIEQKIEIIFSYLLDNGTLLGGLLPQQSLKASNKDNWINEVLAASMLNYKPRTLRTKAKTSVLPIAWRVHPTNRGFQYSLKDILQYKEDTSTNT